MAGKGTEKFESEIEVYEPLLLDETARLQVDDRTVCKFLLIKRNGTVTLVCGPVKEFTYHAMLLDRFCRDRDIPASWTKPREHLEVFDAELEVRGGGWLEIQPEARRIRIFGVSTAYGAYHRDTLNRLLGGQEALAAFAVTVE